MLLPGRTPLHQTRVGEERARDRFEYREGGRSPGFQANLSYRRRKPGREDGRGALSQKSKTTKLSNLKKLELNRVAMGKRKGGQGMKRQSCETFSVDMVVGTQVSKEKKQKKGIRIPRKRKHQGTQHAEVGNLWPQKTRGRDAAMRISKKESLKRH